MKQQQRQIINNQRISHQRTGSQRMSNRQPSFGAFTRMTRSALVGVTWGAVTGVSRGALLGAVRVAVLLSLLLVGTVALSTRVASASIAESLRGFGDELFEWQSGKPLSKNRELLLNGARLQLMTISIPANVSHALAQFEAFACQGSGLLEPLQFAGLSSFAPLGESNTALLQGRFKEVSENEGVLACLDTGGALSLTDLAERISTFTQTGDLSALGKLRYMLARQHGKDTTALVVWTDSAIPLFSLFSQGGDAPGFDVAGVPRAPSSQRLLSAKERGSPHSVAIYRLPSLSKAEALNWYQAALSPDWVIAPAAEGLITATRGSRALAVRVLASATGQGCTVTVTEQAQ